MIPTNILNEYKIVLKQADWNYKYADDPRVHREGEDSVRIALSMRDLLKVNHPENAEEIQQMLVDSRGH